MMISMISSSPKAAYITLTAEMLHAGATNQHGFTNHQLKILGVERRRGWLKDLIGVEIPTATYRAFLEANQYRGSTRRRRRPKPRPRHKLRADWSVPVGATLFRGIPLSDGSVPWD